MNKDIYKKNLEENKIIIEKRINEYFDSTSILDEAMKYSMEAGKRIRASLYLETCKILGHDLSGADIDFALAIEMLQSYTLVHDDLPAMDNDDYRRGKESTHKHFGEDIGILTGDALLNEGANLIFSLAKENPDYIGAGDYLFKKLGKRGVIYGQVLDLEERKDYDLDFILRVYEKKTADFFVACLVAGGLVAGADSKVIESLEKYGYYLGLGFQIQDDLLENEYTDELNILNIMDRQKANSILDEINKKCKLAISDIENNDFYIFLIDYLSKRNY
ncbi:MAG: polyprenyl synthetase family protein [Anaerococcus sp.]|nr:polyprenyl synthetase family protein [Anaerococcus sp.]